MSDSANPKLIEALRKAVSRTSMMAEGIDPELDLTLKHIRQRIAAGANESAVNTILKNAEPQLMAADEAREERAKVLRDTLQDLVELLDSIPGKTVSANHKSELLAKIRSQWKESYHWPSLIQSYLKLAEETISLNVVEPEEKTSIFKRFFNKNSKENPQKPVKSEKDIVLEVAQSLNSLLENLSLPENYDDQITDVKTFLKDSEEVQHIPKMVSEATNLALIALGKTQQELTSYLSQLNSQLASINASIVTSYKNQRTLTSSRHDFNSELQKQVTETSNAVLDATNLGDLKSLIENRLSTISETMTQYQKQMLDQEKAANQSISQLRSKVGKMEKDASTLRLNLQQKLAQAMTDALTNLPNRAAYQDTILPLCKMGKNDAGKRLALAVLDIDHFKAVNDTWGHLAGDKVLRLVPRQIRIALTDKDLPFRYGGEEFVVLMPATDIISIKEKMEEVRHSIEQMPFNMQGVPVPITISIGVALLQDNESPESLFDRADKCLYMAKEQGRNRVVVDPI